MQPSATSAPAASASRPPPGSSLDRPDDAERDLLDRELRDVDHRTAEALVDRRRVLEVLVDLVEVGIAAVTAHEDDSLAPDLREPPCVDRQPDDPCRVDLEKLLRRFDPLDERHVRRLPPEVAEVDREGCLRCAR